MTGRALNANMLYYLFDSSNMHRWNDHLRTLDLTELDKQAHKAAITWVLGRCEQDAGHDIDWEAVVRKCLYSFMQRIALTDLKPQVFHRIKQEKAEEVSRYVIEEFDRRVPDTSKVFRDGFIDFLRDEGDSREDHIVNAAHYLATKWEFDTIYDVNRSIYGIEVTRGEIDDQIGLHSDLVGVSALTDRSTGLSKFVDVVGQLRFQQRWARTPRMPKTTVLGHSLLVADTVYLNDMDNGISGEQILDDFYTGLFHDFPEVLTKDVITPVKTNVNGLPDLLEGIEHDMVENNIMSLIPEGWRDSLRYMAYDPFSNTESPKRNGRQIKAADWMAAWMEAHISMCYGVTSRTLREGVVEIAGKLTQPGGQGETIDAEGLLEEFRVMDIRSGLSRSRKS